MISETKEGTVRYITRILRHAWKGAARFAPASCWSLLLFFLSAAATLSEKTPELESAMCASGSGAFLSLLFALLLEGTCFPRPAQYGIFFLPAALYPYFASLSGTDQWYAAAGISAAALALSCWILCRRYGSAAFPRLFAGMLKSAGLALLLLLSLETCLFAWDSLIMDIRGAWYEVVLEFSLFAGGFQFFLAWVPKEAGPAPAALTWVLRRLLFPVYLVLLAILYGYLGKIGVTGTLPSGEINWFASLAVLGYTVFYFLDPLPEGKLCQWWPRYGALFLAPVAAVQLWCVYIRLSAYGLTMLRYASLLCTAFGLLVMVSGLFQRGRILFYPLAAALLLAVTVTPLQLRQVPVRDQEMRAQQVMESAGMMRGGDIVEGRPLRPEERERLLSAYRYLRHHDEGEVYTFASQIAQSPVLEALSEAAYDKDSPYAWRERLPDMVISVAGYDRLIPFRESVEDGRLRIACGEDFLWEEDAQAYLEGLFEKEHRKGTMAGSEMIWQADLDHQVVFQRVERIAQEGKPVRYDTEGFLLVKVP